jgi:hypothetical protein
MASGLAGGRDRCCVSIRLPPAASRRVGGGESGVRGTEEKYDLLSFIPIAAMALTFHGGSTAVAVWLGVHAALIVQTRSIRRLVQRAHSSCLPFPPSPPGSWSNFRIHRIILFPRHIAHIPVSSHYITLRLRPLICRWGWGGCSCGLCPLPNFRHCRPGGTQPRPPQPHPYTSFCEIWRGGTDGV